MKTAAVQEQEVLETGINTRLYHKSFHDLSTKAPFVKSKKIVRRVDKGNQLLAMLGIEDYTSRTKVSRPATRSLLPSLFISLAFQESCSCILVFYEMNNDNCKVTVDADLIQRFNNFCALFGETHEDEKPILHAIKSLVRKNSIIMIAGKDYMLNPLIAGGLMKVSAANS